ncbi:CBS domain-containing protein [Nonomuraea sp. NPDC046570]|uniref:CBS domain-containing protein n=1 Tax=Nonomuraea sp. NPDC046570 TaxID=3155255 RepID=UPI0033E7DD5F
MRMTVADLMTTDVVAVHDTTPFQMVAEILVESGVSGLPVVDEDDRVLGVVSAADLLRKEEFRQRFAGDRYRPPLRARLRHGFGAEGDTFRKAEGETAGDLMTSPAIVAKPDFSVVRAARLMDRHGVKRLPVLDAEGGLIGIVSRGDLLKVFVRQDAEIERELRGLACVTQAAHLEITVAQGVVGLTGRTDRRSEADAIVCGAERIDGVVGVHADFTWARDDTVPVTSWAGV